MCVCVSVLCVFDFLCQDTGFVQDWGVPQNRNVLKKAQRAVKPIEFKGIQEFEP